MSLESVSVNEKKRKFEEIKNKIENGAYSFVNTEKSRSEVWKCFNKIQEENDYVQCKICKKILVYRNQTTSNLILHPCFKKLKQDKTKVSDTEKKEFTVLCTHWSISNLVPFSIVSGNGFKQVVEKLIKIGASYQNNEVDVEDLVPHRTTISNNINKLYDHYIIKIKEEVGEIKFGAITTDLWSDSFKRLAYIGITIHYVKNGHLHDRILAVKHFDSDRQTAVNITYKLNSICNDYGINMENVTFVTDRGANMIAALCNFDRLSCAAHIINNALNNAAKPTKSPIFSELVNNCKKLVRFFKKSTNLQQNLKSSLKSGCETRWNSNLNMFQSIKENYNEIIQILTAKNEISKIQNIDIQHLTEAIDFLTPFNEALEELQKSKQPTLYLCYPYFLDLYQNCNEKETDSTFLKLYKLNVANYIKENWEKEIKPQHFAATFLFPICKDLSMLPQAKKEEIYTYISGLYAKLVQNSNDSSGEVPRSNTTNQKRIFRAFIQEDVQPATIDGKQLFLIIIFFYTDNLFFQALNYNNMNVKSGFLPKYLNKNKHILYFKKYTYIFPYSLYIY